MSGDDDDADLAAALGRALGNGSLVPHYQPKYDLFRRRITGVEALVRWPGQEGVPPARFIPVAERAGMIGVLGRRVLEQSCRQAAEWRKRGFDLTVAVNVSPLQLAPDAGLDRMAAAALADSGLPPNLLEVEVTEGVLMEEGARTTLGRLRSQGISIALDDFGTGYSSLAYLRHLRA